MNDSNELTPVEDLAANLIEICELSTRASETRACDEDALALFEGSNLAGLSTGLAFDGLGF